MRHTEFWARMELVLGTSYARVWAQQQVLCIVGRKIVGAGLGVGVMLVERLLPNDSPLEITAFASRFIE